MATWDFDPPIALTLEEVTQHFRDMYKNIPDARKEQLVSENPVIAQYLVQNE